MVRKGGYQILDLKELYDLFDYVIDNVGDNYSDLQTYLTNNPLIKKRIAENILKKAPINNNKPILVYYPVSVSDDATLGEGTIPVFATTYSYYITSKTNYGINFMLMVESEVINITISRVNDTYNISISYVK